jgi:hypothetical protein
MSDSPTSPTDGDNTNVGPNTSRSVPQAQFTEDQRAKLGDWFRTQWRHRECPVCGHNNYAPPDKAWEVRPFRGGQTVIGGPGGILPMFPVTCTTCGYIIWINAIVAGVIGQSKPSPVNRPGNPGGSIP